MNIVERLKFDAARCEATFSKGVASNIEEAAAEIERLRALLERALKSIEGGQWRDKANLSAEAHPVWDDVREKIRSHQQRTNDEK